MEVELDLLRKLFPSKFLDVKNSIETRAETAKKKSEEEGKNSYFQMKISKTKLPLIS